MVKKYIPERGDIVWATLDPRKGHEQKGRRPVFVLSARRYNEKTHLALMCPITSRTKKYPFDVVFVGKKTSGSVLVDQVKSLDWTERDISFIESTNIHTITEIQKKVLLLVLGN